MSLDKQGTRNKRVRHLYVTLFGANLTYVICELHARTMVLQRQEPFSFVRWFRTYMLNLRLIFVSKTVESQTIFLRIDQLDELALDTNHRRSIGNAFEHLVLDTLTVIDAMSRHFPQATSARRILGIHVVGNHCQHANHLTSIETAGSRLDRSASNERATAPAHAAQAPGGSSPSKRDG